MIPKGLAVAAAAVLALVLASTAFSRTHAVPTLTGTVGPGFTITLPASAGGLGYVYGSTGQRERENWQSRRGKGSYTLVSRGETPYYAAWLGV